MITIESNGLDEFIGKYSNVTTIYGEGGSGKTTLCLIAAIEQALNNKKVLFLDTENNFSVERFNQLLDKKDKNYLKNILILNIKNFNCQHKQINQLEEIKNISLIIVDSITHFYRRLFKREPELAKAMLSRQLITLNKISKNNIPVIITSQVYSNLKNEIIALSKYRLNKYSEKMIKLEKDPRKIILEKPNKKEIKFQILNEGVRLI